MGAPALSFGGTTTVLPGGATPVVFPLVPQAERNRAPSTGSLADRARVTGS